MIKVTHDAVRRWVSLSILAGSVAISLGQPQANSIVIRPVEPSASIVKKFESAGESDFLQRAADVLDSQIAESFGGKRMFHVLPAPPAAATPSDSTVIQLDGPNSPGSFQMPGARYVLSVTLMDMDNRAVPLAEGQATARIQNEQRMELAQKQAHLRALRTQVEVAFQNTRPGPRKKALRGKREELDRQLSETHKRVQAIQSVDSTVNFEKQTRVQLSLRLQAGFNLYDGSTGNRLTDLQSRTFETNQVKSVVSTGLPAATSSEELLLELARLTARWVADGVVDVANPPVILEKSAGQVTINRGENAQVKVGHTYLVYAVGKTFASATGPITDEVQVGKIRVDSVASETAKARILEDNGVAVGAILKSLKR